MDQEPSRSTQSQSQTQTQGDVPYEAAGEAIPAPSGESNLIDTDYVIGQDNIKGQFSFALDIHGKVFSISAITILLFVFITLALQNEIEPIFNAVRDWLTGNLAWFFLGAANIFVILCLVLIVTPLGKVRLGGMDAKPDHSYLSWFSMLFAAGMGIGLMFYGVSEPMSHFSAAMDGVAVGEDGLRTDWSPLGGAAGDAAAASSLGMASTIFHWGLHPWAIYAVVALALALFSFNKGLPLSIRSIFYPILGERVWGWPGHVIDILAVFATLFGLATSLGIGAQQASGGLDYLFGIEANNASMVLLIIGITAIALMSVLAGLDKGVKRLSQLNMVLAILLLGFIIIVGPTLAIITGFFTNLGSYLQHLPALSNPIGREDANFSQGWTAFYWAWWISWSPFVGMFIARVSRGRTVREFLIAVLLVPSLVSVLWMTA
ncbi:MAG: BCCT family transporter, partial [Pseudomonas sp.]